MQRFFICMVQQYKLLEQNAYDSRKLMDLELRESAAKVVKATTSFPLTPPFNGFTDDSSSIRSYSSTLISTPVARSETLQIQEEEINRLEKENIKQRQEVFILNF